MAPSDVPTPSRASLRYCPPKSLLTLIAAVARLRGCMTLWQTINKMFLNSSLERVEVLPTTRLLNECVACFDIWLLKVQGNPCGELAGRLFHQTTHIAVTDDEVITQV